MKKRLHPDTVREGLTDTQTLVYCHFCGARRVYNTRQLEHLKHPYRCKTCATAIRLGKLEDVTYDR